MAVELKVDKISEKQLSTKFKVLEFLYPEEIFRAIVTILFDIKLIAQKKLKADGHIVTARLRNSIYVKSPRQIFANRSNNKTAYTYPGGTDKQGRKQPGGSGNRDLNTSLRGAEAAVGTNVVYARNIEEKHDSFLQYAVDTVDSDKRFKEAEKRVKKRIMKKGIAVGKGIVKGLFS